MEMPPDIAKLAAAVIKALKAKGLTIVTAESCTGGLIAGALTSVSGSSDAVYGGFVTYANAAKTEMIGVLPDLLWAHGAVSEEVAIAMADGARRSAGTAMAVSVTGVAGPLGGSKEKPVGRVHFAVSTAAGTRHLKKSFDPTWSRDQIRHASVVQALKLVRAAL